ncbi:hypothetical protein NQZ79_g8237 [Umbelopsis isabellina]|nr:hypothetical protein NQZ79_g8237 [Umbelopsis isabellina]
MATYGEEVEAFLNAETPLSSSPVTPRLMQDEQGNSEMRHRDLRAEIPSSRTQDLKDDHAHSKSTNIGLGVAFNEENRYQHLQPTKSNREHCWWGEELLDEIADLSYEDLSGDILKHGYTGQHDFVLLSEFSEMQGPLPLAVVIEDACLDLEVINVKNETIANDEHSYPEDAKSFLAKIGIKKFDLNSFVLRIVSVDRSSEQRRSFDDDNFIPPNQSPSVDPNDSFTFETAAGDTAPFRIPEDAQIYSYDSEGKFYSFTQYLTLFDISARGYVRPVSISYVTKDPHKILPRFSVYMERFTKVSQILKLGNFPNFVRDLHNRLQDLEFTESHLSPKQDGCDTENTHTPSQNEAVDSAKEDQSLSSETISQAIVELKAIIDQVEHHPVLFSSKTKETSDPQVGSSVESDIPDIALSGEPKSNLQTSEKSRPNTVASSVVAMTRTVSRGISTVTELLPFKGPWISSLVETHRNDDPKGTSAQDSDKQKHIESVEREAHSTTESTYEPQMVHNIFPVVPTDRKLRTLSQLCSPSRVSIVTQDDVRNSLLSSPIVEPQLESKGFDANVQPSHSLHIDLDKYAEAISEIMDIVRDLGRNSVSLDIQDEDLDVASPSSAILSIGRSMVMNVKNPAPRRLGTTSIQEEDDQHLSESTLKLELGGHRIRGERLYTVDNQSTQSRKPPLFDESEEKTSATIPSSEDVQVADKAPDENYILSLIGGQIWDRNDGDPGTGLKSVLQKHARYIKHVIFALMSGRMTLVVGGASSEESVKAVVLALSLFVPGHSRRKHRVIKWYADDLTEDKLAGVKLIGVQKDKVDAAIYASDVSVFDVDNVETDGLGGSLSDAALIAHIHTIFFDIALKAYVLYHAFLHNHHIAEFIPEPVINKALVQSSAEPSRDSQKWSMKKLVDYWRRLDERENTNEHKNALDTALNSDTQDKLYTWSDANAASLDFKALSNFMATKESSLSAERPQFLSLSSAHESNMLRNQIAKAAAGMDVDSESKEHENGEGSNHEQNEATVTLESIAVAREQRPALADLNWDQENQQSATPPKAIPSKDMSRPNTEKNTSHHIPPVAYGSLQSEYSTLSYATGTTSCYYTSAMSQALNEEDESVNDDDTGVSESFGSCSSDSSEEGEESSTSNAAASPKSSNMASIDIDRIGFSDREDEGRRFMTEELGVKGDDQTIVEVRFSYLDTNVIVLC